MVFEHRLRRGRWLLLAMTMLACPALAAEADGADADEAEVDGAGAIPKTGPDGRNPLVDRLSERLGPGLAGPVPDGFDALPALAGAAAAPAEGELAAEGEPAAEAPAGPAADAMTVVEAMIDSHALTPKAAASADDRRDRRRGAETAAKPPPPKGVPAPLPARLVAEVPGDGPRLLLVDAGAIFFTPDGQAWVPVPDQQVAVPPPKAVARVELLPLRPEQTPPPPGTPLTAAMTTDPALLAVLRTVQRIESEDVVRLRRYLERDGDGFTVKTFVRNEDVRVAGWMRWRRGADGRAVGTLPPDAVRMAIFAVTAGYTIQDIADWLRFVRRMDMEPAIEEARTLARQSEFILERAGLEHRVLSPRHAEFMYNRGVAAFDEGDLERAEKHFRAAIENRSEMIDAHYNLGVTLYRAGKYKEASSAFLVASGMEGAPARVFYNRGATLYRLDDKLGAARQFRKALAAGYAPEAIEAWLEKADPEGRTAPRKKTADKKRKR